MSKTPSKELRGKWKDFVAHHKVMGTNVLRLMRHPDATPEQVWELHLKYTEAMKKLYDLRDVLRERYPDGAFMPSQYQWNVRGEL